MLMYIVQLRTWLKHATLRKQGNVTLHQTAPPRLSSLKALFVCELVPRENTRCIEKVYLYLFLYTGQSQRRLVSDILMRNPNQIIFRERDGC
jgi:hypothetical protein